MSGWTDNPFASKAEDNPFADPSVASATATLPEYNPFEKTTAAAPIAAAPVSAPAEVSAGASAFGKSKSKVAPAAAAETPSWAQPAAAAPAPAPAPVHAAQPSQAPQWSQQAQQPAQAVTPTAEDIRRQQEYEKREQDAAVKADPARTPNFPPFPKFMRWGPFVPCYYVNIKAEIPVEARTTVKIALYTWELLAIALFWNFIGCMSALAGSASGQSISCALSAMYLVLFTPCSYHCWFHSLYGAVRLDSSLKFGWFFFVMFFQILSCIFFALGVEGTGAAGIIVGAKTVDDNSAAGIIIFISAILWIVLGLLVLYVLSRTLRYYRSSGQSMQKAGNEAAVGVASNKNVQKAALNAAVEGYGSA